MKKGQAVKFWKELSNSTSIKEVISAFENKKGYGGKRTLERCSQAAAGFKEELSSETIAMRTGWSVKYVDKIRIWWKEAFPSEVGPVTQEPYEETPHTQKMCELAKALAERISLPSSWDKDYLWKDMPVDFRPGKYSLSIGLVEIGEDKQVKVKYPDIGPGIAEPYLVRALFSHLSTSGLTRFMELVGDNGKLSILSGKAGQYSQALLLFLKLIADEVKGYGAKVDFRDELKPGLTKWFILTAWNDAIQKASGHSWIDNSWYKPHESIPGTNLWQLRCGAYSIGIARSKRTLKTYENWHKKLRAKYAAHQSVKDINYKNQEMGDYAQDIRQRLQEFSDMQRFPGHCELC